MDTPEYKDPFTKLRQKFDDYEIELPDNDWTEFSKKLAESQTTRRRFAWYYIPAAASLIGLMFGAFSYLFTDHEAHNPSTPLAYLKIEEKHQKSKPTIEKENSRLQTKVFIVKSAHNQSKSSVQKSIHPGCSQPQDAEESTSGLRLTQDNTISNGIASTSNRKDRATNQSNNQPTKTELEFDTTGYITHPVKPYTEVAEITTSKEEKNRDKRKSGAANVVKWLAGSFQGNLGISAISNSTDILSDGSIGSQLLTRVAKADALQSSTTPNTMSFTGNKTHHTPLTFGVSLGIPLSERWELQTGIAYTLLVTTGEIGSSSNTKATGRIEQNYLGIPVSLSYAFIKKNAFSVYIVGGGKIDKGISLVEKTYTYNGQDKLINQSHYQYSISGLQFSLDAGLGTSYRIYRFINWYLEAGGAWYIPSNQPESAHTEYPLSAALKTGVKFTFLK